MLILPRKKNESIVIGDDIVVTVIEIRGDRVRLGVVLPRDKPVHRMEVWEAIRGPWPGSHVDPAWLTWQDGAILQLARVIRDRGEYDALPILADALEEAGCSDSAMLDHCRTAGPDTRHSWVVDLLLAAS